MTGPASPAVAAYELRPVGHVESPLVDRASAPKQGFEGAPQAWLVFHLEMAEGIRDLTVGAEVFVLTWLHRARRDVLAVHPRDASRLLAHYTDRAGDTVVLSESAVAIMQGRARDWRTIHPGRLARWLSKRVTKTTWGTGLRSPYAMQYAIELIGVPRILLAAGAHLVGRLAGQKGWFYLVAGLDARMMDAEHTMGIAEFYEMCIPAPHDPPGTARDLIRPAEHDLFR